MCAVRRVCPLAAYIHSSLIFAMGRQLRITYTNVCLTPAVPYLYRVCTRLSIFMDIRNNVFFFVVRGNKENINTV